MCFVVICGSPVSLHLTRAQAHLRGVERRLQEHFGSPEDRLREYRQGMQYGGEAPKQVVHPFVPTPDQQGVVFDTQVGDEPQGQPSLGLPSFSLGPIGGLAGLQALFAIVYYWLVVKHYPPLSSPTPASSQLQAMFAPMATCRASPYNCLLSWCCSQARAAHTFSRTWTLDYWLGCLLMFICPCCTLCYTNACTDLNPKLGGEPVNPLWSALTAWFCPCCVIAQDAESLDAATGAKTEFCGVGPGGGGGMGGPMQPMPMATGMSGQTATATGPMVSGPMGSGSPMASGPMGSATAFLQSPTPQQSGMTGVSGGPSLGSRMTGSFGSPMGSQPMQFR